VVSIVLLLSSYFDSGWGWVGVRVRVRVRELVCAEPIASENTVFKYSGSYHRRSSDDVMTHHTSYHIRCQN
jgi:hypothetical protein